MGNPFGRRVGKRVFVVNIGEVVERTIRRSQKHGGVHSLQPGRENGLGLSSYVTSFGVSSETRSPFFRTHLPPIAARARDYYVTHPIADKRERGSRDRIFVDLPAR